MTSPHGLVLHKRNSPRSALYQSQIRNALRSATYGVRVNLGCQAVGTQVKSTQAGNCDLAVVLPRPDLARFWTLRVAIGRANVAELWQLQQVHRRPEVATVKASPMAGHCKRDVAGRAVARFPVAPGGERYGTSGELMTLSNQ